MNENSASRPWGINAINDDQENKLLSAEYAENMILALTNNEMNNDKSRNNGKEEEILSEEEEIKMTSSLSFKTIINALASSLPFSIEKELLLCDFFAKIPYLVIDGSNCADF